MKTKHGIIFGVAALLFAAIVLFAACGGGGGSSGPSVTVPKPGSLPSLPTGATAATETDTTWIGEVLEGLDSTFNNSFYGSLENAVETAATANGDDIEETPFNFKGDINLSSFYGITSGTLTVTVHAEFEGTDESGRESSKVDTEAKTDIVTTSGITVLAGSVWSQAYSASGNKNSYKSTEKTAFGFTVTKGGKAAKIVYSLTYTETGNASGGKWNENGTITVYGADNAVVYTDTIKDSGSEEWDD
jgi:hypothetical protein